MHSSGELVQVNHIKILNVRFRIIHAIIMPVLFSSQVLLASVQNYRTCTVVLVV